MFHLLMEALLFLSQDQCYHLQQCKQTPRTTNLQHFIPSSQSLTIVILPILGNLPVKRAKDAVCFLQWCGMRLVSSYTVCFLQRGGVSLALSAIIYNILKVSRGIMRSAASSYAAMHMVAGSRPVFVIA